MYQFLSLSILYTVDKKILFIQHEAEENLVIKGTDVRVLLMKCWFRRSAITCKLFLLFRKTLIINQEVIKKMFFMCLFDKTNIIIISRRLIYCVLPKIKSKLVKSCTSNIMFLTQLIVVLGILILFTFQMYDFLAYT